MTVAEKEYLNRVAKVGCILCHHLGLGHTEPTIHHAREGEGAAQRAPDWLAIPLCKEHHQGDTGWHGLGKRAFYARYKLDEMDLLAMTIQAVFSTSRPVQGAAPALVPAAAPRKQRSASRARAGAPAGDYTPLPKILPRRGFA
jgi:hypothetical protein